MRPSSLGSQPKIRPDFYGVSLEWALVFSRCCFLAPLLLVIYFYIFLLEKVNEKAIISTFKFSFKITIYISLKDTEDIYHLPHYGTC